VVTVVCPGLQVQSQQLRERLVELELETARKDLIKSEEMNHKYQRDIKEVGLGKTLSHSFTDTHTHTRARTHTVQVLVHLRREQCVVVRSVVMPSWHGCVCVCLCVS
jgi:hypothetical protein